MEKLLPGETSGVPNTSRVNPFDDWYNNPWTQFGIGVLSGNRGNYGRAGPALAAGFQNIGQWKAQQAKDAYNKRQQDLLDIHYGNETMRAQNDRRKLEQQQRASKAETKMFLPGFMRTAGIQGQGFDIDEDGNLVPVEAPNMQPIAANTDWMQDAGDEYKGMIAAAMQSDDPMVRRQAINEMYRYYRDSKKNTQQAKDMIAKERAIAEAMGMDVGQYLKQKMTRQPLVQFNSPLAVMNEEATKKAGGKEGYDIGEQAAMIENKYSAIDSVREARDMLKKGIYSGYWADMRKTMAKASMGAIGDRQKAARTEEFMSYVGNTVVPRLKEFGGNDSNEEMRYLQRIMGGDITMEPEAIAAILESAERKIARGIERLQRQRGALEQGDMPDLGPGPSRLKAGKKPSVDELLKKYGGR